METLDNFIQKHDIHMRSKGNAVCQNCDIDVKAANEPNSYTALVQSENNYRKTYKITLAIKNDCWSASCTCPACIDDIDHCKHIIGVAMMLRINSILKKESKTNKADVVEKQKSIKGIPNIIRVNEINATTWESFCANNTDRNKANEYLSNYNNKIIAVSKNEIKWEFDADWRSRGETYYATLNLNRDDTKNHHCNCQQHASGKFCPHITAMVMHLGNQYLTLLQTVLDYESLINKDSKRYGFSGDEPDLEDFFELNLKGDRYSGYSLTLLPKDKKLQPISEFVKLEYIKPTKNFRNLNFTQKTIQKEETFLIYVWQTKVAKFPYFNITPILCKFNKSGTISKRFEYVLDRDFSLVRLNKMGISSEEIENLGYLIGINEILYNIDSANAQDEFELFRQRFSKFFSKIKNSKNYIDEKDNFDIEKAQPIILSNDRAELNLIVEKEGDCFFTVKPQFIVNKVPLKDVKNQVFFVLSQNTMYLLNPMDTNYNKAFERHPFIKWHLNQYENIYNTYLFPAQEHVTVYLDKTFNQKPIETLVEDKIETKVYLNESESNLIITPTFNYVYDTVEKEIDFNSGKYILVTEGSNTKQFQRNLEFEKEHYEFVKTLHPLFLEQDDASFFVLPNNEVLNQNWLLKFYETLNDKNIEVQGNKNLTKFNYNANKPKITITAGSGTDWFDIKVEVKFGNQILSINDLRTSIINKQQYVKLNDGSIGIIPDEWLSKYKGLFNVGKLNKNGGIDVNAFQASALDDISEEITNNENIIKFQNKIASLKNAKEFTDDKAPKNLKADLRDYQLQGYNWLNYLQSINWGGCLADDMGLGKTLQMLAFIQNQVNKNKKFCALVVMPTSLIFNWENEINKFTTGVKYHKHVGSNRNDKKINFRKFNLTITTYGLCRIDTELLKETHFDVIVLDESQAIKNHTSQIAKSVKTLNAKNKFVMTGTPIENSTLDLYSQMDFVNPGMLGSAEYFKQTYAYQIDKNQDVNSALQLKKIIYPFILNRKKQQVAKDLPEKTEIILYCEMATDQRRVYEHYKEKIRNDLIKKIDSIGLAKAGMDVLQGLLKLRQICNSTKLLQDADYSRVSSVKTDLLIENIEELVSENHKVLVFSFFSSMLDILEEDLKKHKIKTVKITGEVTNRQDLVNEFQTNENVKVFLISLKAGGFGLNLTEADYVFLFDPWWNPAAEQQAIDRTHRIGQTKNVFAYKLICKDTIEEKILALQAKKKAVSDDIINIDNAVLKQLKKDDIINLFS